jgi:hypothetical protein
VEGHLLVAAVDRAAAAEDEARDPGVARRLQQHGRAGAVHVVVEHRVLQARPYAGHRGEVHHRRGLVLAERAAHGVAVADVALQQREAAARQPGHVPALDGRVVVGVEVVEADDGVAARGSRARWLPMNPAAPVTRIVLATRLFDRDALGQLRGWSMSQPVFGHEVRQQLQRHHDVDDGERSSSTCGTGGPSASAPRAGRPPSATAMRPSRLFASCMRQHLSYTRPAWR